MGQSSGIRTKIDDPFFPNFKGYPATSCSAIRRRRSPPPPKRSERFADKPAHDVLHGARHRIVVAVVGQAAAEGDRARREDCAAGPSRNRPCRRARSRPRRGPSSGGSGGPRARRGSWLRWPSERASRTAALAGRAEREIGRSSSKPAAPPPDSRSRRTCRPHALEDPGRWSSRDAGSPAIGIALERALAREADAAEQLAAAGRLRRHSPP